MTSAARNPLYLVDAFASSPFGGNPAAVCLLERWPGDTWLQKVAAELNQSETAFVVPSRQGYELRWLTPTVEVDLCGHATLAAASVLWQSQRADPDAPIGFNTRSGILTARRKGGLIDLDFPLEPVRQVAPAAGLLEALGANATYVGRSRFDYLVEVASESELRRISPNFGELASIDCRGVMVTAASSDSSFDFVSRFFAPASGIDEDPVTGSAHCTLAHFWQSRLRKDRFRAFQASARGGVIDVAVVGERVLLSGQATMVFEGALVSGSSS